MPFPGSQQNNTIDFAYFLGRNIWWLRIIAVLLLVYPVVRVFKYGSRSGKIWLVGGFIAYAVVVYMVNFKMEADKMFYHPTVIRFAGYDQYTIAADKLILGVAVNGQAKAYPIQLIGYHHQVADTIGNTPVIVTYCTVCRTGRVYSPQVNGKNEIFRLVGMDHYNAMFEDATTKSWWRQVSGEAIAGPLKAKTLAEIPSEQMVLAAWQRRYPSTLVLQPDTLFKESFEKMASYDKGLSKGSLTKRDSGSWKPKSWVVGIQQTNASKAYDWNQLVKSHLIEDSMPGLPLMITLEKDTASFHAFDRRVDGLALHFKRSSDSTIIDTNTGSTWNEDGKCITGPLVGKQLRSVRAYQEFWHSWQTFHPGPGKFLGR
jgi:hypothetical protein